MLKGKKLEIIKEKPLSNFDIKKYLPDAKIITYDELSTYNDINELLQKDKDYAIMLYENSENVGHWVCILKPNANTIEFFDPYGLEPDKQLKYSEYSNDGNKYLTNLLNKTTQRVIYNPIAYQKEKQDINTCGRWCVARVITMLNGISLDKFYKMFVNTKKETKKDYDSIVSSIIDKI
jgi:hypothetical protein